MNREGVFVDIGAWIGLLSNSDVHHLRAVEVLATLLAQNRPLITTHAIVLEVGDGLATKRRRQFSGAFQALLLAPYTEVVALEESRLAEAWALYDGRRDKEWSLTDCFSFVVMREYDLRDAFAHDHHFEQAGFRALMRA